MNEIELTNTVIEKKRFEKAIDLQYSRGLSIKNKRRKKT